MDRSEKSVADMDLKNGQPCDGAAWIGVKFEFRRVEALHKSLQRFLQPSRPPRQKWVQPLEGALGSLMDVLSNVRVLSSMVLDYLPRYRFEVCLIEPCNGVYPSKPYVRCVDFVHKTVLRLDVCGRGWESASWLHRWANREKSLAFQKDAQTQDNMCGFLDWEKRRSDIGDRNPPLFSLRLYETENGEEETERWLEEEEKIDLKENEAYRDEHDYNQMSWEARLLERSISGRDDQKGVAARLLESKVDIPLAQDMTLDFQFNDESPTENTSHIRFHVSYDGRQNPRDQLYMHLISAQLFIPLPPSTLIPH